VIAVDCISKRYGPVAALDRASLRIGRGEIVALLGPSGCGKTTLLRVVAGFERPDGGTVEIAGERVAGDGAWAAPERRRVGMVFQDYALFPHLTVAQNVGYGVCRRERGRRVPELLRLVGLEGLEGRYPHMLSGGQQQRVALARALAPRPEVVLLDEPWSNIDPLLRASLRDELAEILRAVDVTVLLVTHDREEAFSLADRIALMREGEIVQAAPPEELYFAPADRWAARFVGEGNLLPGAITAGGRVETPVGVFPTTNANGHRSVEALVRPELLRLSLDPGGAGQVVAREFRGHDVFYRVRLADGTDVCSQRPSNEVVPLGARVSVEAHPMPVPVFH
jgi:iron(III) transport system ATP-binding protein